MRRITSISLGSTARDKAAVARFLGEEFTIERIGTNGDMDLFRKRLVELDGKVDAFGLGGTDMYIWAGGRRYTFREIEHLASAATKTPVVDGSGLKNTLERENVLRLQREGTVDFAHSKVLLVSGVDRFGMAEALNETGALVVYGDFMVGLDIPIALRSLRALQSAARVMLPLVVRMPFKWLYPTGEKQNTITPKWGKFYAEADIIVGDFPYIRRYMPDTLLGKTILTNTTRPDDVAELTKRGVKTLITTTPEIDGGSFGTNVMEGVLVALSDKKPDELMPADYMDLLTRLDWTPRVQTLNG
jgi:hypothetical protein